MNVEDKPPLQISKGMGNAFRHCRIDTRSLHRIQVRRRKYDLSLILAGYLGCSVIRKLSDLDMVFGGHGREE